MIMRWLKKPIDEFPLHLTDSQRRAADALYAVLRRKTKAPFNIVSPLIHDLMMTLFEMYPEKKGSDFQCVVVRFIVISHTQPSGQIFQPKTISPNLACLQWCVRGTFLKAIQMYGGGEAA